MGNIKNHYIYKYAMRRLKKKCSLKPGLSRVSDEQKVKICKTVAKRVRSIAIVIGIIYFILMSVLNMLAVMYPYSSPFVTWYIDRFESVLPLTQYGRLYSRANILSMLILLIPVILIIAGPLFILILLITDIELNKELREHFGDLDE